MIATPGSMPAYNNSHHIQPAYHSSKAIAVYDYWLDRRFFLKTARRPKKKSLGRRTTVLPAKKNRCRRTTDLPLVVINMKITAVVIDSASCNHRRSAAWPRGMIPASDAEHPWFESG
jgi:hypothetical protein